MSSLGGITHPACGSKDSFWARANSAIIYRLCYKIVLHSFTLRGLALQGRFGSKLPADPGQKEGEVTVNCIGDRYEIALYLVHDRGDMENVKSGIKQPGSSGTEEPATTKLTPERARSILQEHGMEVSLEQAEAILGFLRKLAMISTPKLFEK